MKFILLLFLLIGFLSLFKNSETMALASSYSNVDNSTKKVALLIGNIEYKFQPLSNPINDVHLIKKSLIEIGFKEDNVVVLENASRQEMIKALIALRDRATQAEISFIYFSGHGMQVNNTNYMFPANTTAKTSLDIEGLIRLDAFIDSVTTAKYGIVLVDACRNNPLVNNFSKGFKGSVAKGLGQVRLASELERIIIGFPTRAGELALDGEGENSPYAKALAKNLKFNLDIRRILSEASREVLEVTKNNNPPQKPIYEDTLGREAVCLTGICTGENLKIEHTKPTEVSFVEPELENINKIAKLMYQKEPSLGLFTWSEAKRYCNNITLKGYSDWRLPTKKELKKILKREKIKQKEIHLWTLYKGKDGLVPTVIVDDNDWYESPTPKKWKNPSLCVRKIR